MLDNKQIGDNLKLARETIGLNKRQFATKAGVDVSQYGRVERGLEGFGRDNLIQIANKHGLNVDFLSTGTGFIFANVDKPATEKGKQEHAADNIQVLTPEQIMSVLSVALQGQVEIIKTQTKLLGAIKKEMATVETKAKASLNYLTRVAVKISDVQDQMRIVQGEEQANLRADKRDVSSDADSKLDQTGENGKSNRSHRAKRK